MANIKCSKIDMNNTGASVSKEKSQELLPSRDFSYESSDILNLYRMVPQHRAVLGGKIVIRAPDMLVAAHA